MILSYKSLSNDEALIVQNIYISLSIYILVQLRRISSDKYMTYFVQVDKRQIWKRNNNAEATISFNKIYIYTERERQRGTDRERYSLIGLLLNVTKYPCYKCYQQCFISHHNLYQLSLFVEYHEMINRQSR